MYKKILTFIERISPVMIEPKTTSITVGISKRFLLFELLQKISEKIEENPYLNFISALKAYKSFGNLISGTVRTLYRDRERAYLRHFFIDQELYHAVKQDIAWAHGINPKATLTITKWGVMIYDNYLLNQFNVLLITPHAGSWMPHDILSKQMLGSEERAVVEDTNTHKIYGDLVLSKGGIWIDVKLSRFACDYNRDRERAIYADKSEPWIDVMWSNALSTRERMWLLEGYDQFYITLKHLIDSYRFNIIFDGHSMKHGPGRPDISIGTQFIPKFYMPVVLSMQRKLITMGYKSVQLNAPFEGGYIMNWMHNRFPDVFTFSIEVNKKLYMNSTLTTDQELLARLARNITDIFNIDVAH